MIKINVIIALKGKLLLETYQYNNHQGIPYIAGSKQEGMPFSGMIKLQKYVE